METNHHVSTLRRVLKYTMYGVHQSYLEEIITIQQKFAVEQQLADLCEKTEQFIDPSVNQCELLATIMTSLSCIMSSYGTLHLEDMTTILLGDSINLIPRNDPEIKSKALLLFETMRPIGYRVLTKDDMELLKSWEWMAFEGEGEERGTIRRLHGLSVVLHNKRNQRGILVHGIIRDLPCSFCTDSIFLSERVQQITEVLHSTVVATNLQRSDEIDIQRFIQTCSLRDMYLEPDLFFLKRLEELQNYRHYVESSTLETVLFEFHKKTWYEQRMCLLYLLTSSGTPDLKTMAYTLYESIMETSQEAGQLLYNTLPLYAKSYFQEVLHNTFQRHNQIIQTYDESDRRTLPPRAQMEQQLLLWKAPESVKNAAILKWQEMKQSRTNNPDDVDSKTKQYLEGLLRIPFGIYREEPLLKYTKSIREEYRRMTNSNTTSITLSPCTTLIEIKNEIESVITKLSTEWRESIQSPTLLLQTLRILKSWLPHEKEVPGATKKTRHLVVDEILKTKWSEETEQRAMKLILPSSQILLMETCYSLLKQIKHVHTVFQSTHDILHSSVYGHGTTKNHIMKVISQWMTGSQSGYCFGFEGSPGLGKTTLAKYGLAQCLRNEHGATRPFHFIALGGSSHGSSLEGHNYTYVNSSWGRIVDILMQSKCMNPIIYIDELDKVSKTEQGKEIIGILMHLIDPTQNNAFQDKYFSGISLDLSKVLFVFSYNNAENIDPILLDRIHRVKFENFTIQEKVAILRDYILPEINEKMGFDKGVIDFRDETVMKYLIETYSNEPGIRKLKELVFDLYGDVNMDALGVGSSACSFPICVTKEWLDQRLKKHLKNVLPTWNGTEKTGVIHGLWANALGQGGILPIETAWCPATQFLDLKLTGMQGEVMRESMNIAKTVAWNWTSPENRAKCLQHAKDNNTLGIHIHCPDGATHKDGPSAGLGIATALYSLWNQIPLQTNMAITGELTLEGEVTAVGGLDAKIVHGIRMGIRTFVYPLDNQQDLENIREKHPGLITTNHVFLPVSQGHPNEWMSK